MAIGTALSVAALAATAISTGVEYYAAKEQKKTSAAIDERNARVQMEAARNYEMQTAEQLRRQRINAKHETARSAARFAKAGVQMEGTPLANLAEQVGRMELQAQDILRQGYGEASQLRQGASLSQFSAASTRRSMPYLAASSLLSGVAKTGAMYSNFRNIGAFTSKPKD